MASNARVLLRNASAAVYSRKNKTTHTSRGSVLSFITPHDSHKPPTLARASDEESPVPTSPDILLIHAISSRGRVRGPKPPPSPKRTPCARQPSRHTRVGLRKPYLTRRRHPFCARDRRVIHAPSSIHPSTVRVEKIPAQNPSIISPRCAFTLRRERERERDARTHTYLDCARSASQRTREVIIVAHGVDIVVNRCRVTRRALPTRRNEWRTFVVWALRIL